MVWWYSINNRFRPLCSLDHNPTHVQCGQVCWEFHGWQVGRYVLALLRLLVSTPFNFYHPLLCPQGSCMHSDNSQSAQGHCEPTPTLVKRAGSVMAAGGRYVMALLRL